MSVFGQSTATVGIFGGILCGAQIVVMLLAIIPTEAALKKTFDDGGHRRKKTNT